MKSGRGPVYMDCRGASKEDIEYMKHWLRNEGNVGLLNHMKDRGIDPFSNAVEFGTYGIDIRGGVSFNMRGETSLPGLFSAGQEFSGDMAFSTILGWVAGESMSEYVKGVDTGDMARAAEDIKEKITLIEAILIVVMGLHGKRQI